ncbi:MAG: aspartate--tRNA ligase [Deltaproteobacteria bacterium]|nr:aspartate--tRNA ligase [Deltaproteobacteria bacterium]MBW2053071.1 aspartate--tRNA ligase [Deltaproteobacteria bacterium]MBW2140510.1 aspartate--tRNA ligase [Deltaproteobacteria bacterium]
MIESMADLKRTHYCTDLTEKDVGQEVALMGWVQRRRDHGGLVFIDLRDRTGLIQTVFNPQEDPETHQRSHAVRSEYVIAVKGRVRPRPDDMINEKLKTGRIEVFIYHLRVLNTAETPPFQIEDDIDVSEAIRLKYRYLDLRRPSVQRNLLLRHKAYQVTRSFLDQEGFIEIETPVLTKSTPEGARDFLVPSRLNPGQFYALPQSPQLFKQLLMVSGFDRYFQIVKCYRDEDFRADRQMEFTQIDIEMSFVDEEDVHDITERLLATVFKELLDIEIPRPFKRLTYAEATSRYGLDKPDTRFGMELKNVTDIVAGSEFKLFSQVAQNGGVIKAINAKGQSSLSRKDLDDLTDFVKIYGAKGLAWIKINPDGWQSPIAKFFSEAEKEALIRALDVEAGDVLFFSADTPKVVNEILGQLRVKLGRALNLINTDEYDFLWVTHFPMFEYSQEEQRYTAMHHPFTAPVEEDLDKLETAPGEVRARAYDLVLNGHEVFGGSIRIHRRDIQEKVFHLLGIGQEEAEEKFGFLIKALEYGAPPHGGIASGFDRLIMIMTGADNIRDVIAFPKTQKATCLLTDAPSKVNRQQLLELAIRLDTENKKEN